MNGIGPHDFREWMSSFPTGVAVVTAVGPDGQPRGMTCSSLVSITLKPATLMVSLRTASATCAAVVGRGAFAVNLLDVHARSIAELFASAEADRFGVVSWTWSASGLPQLTTGAFALAECVVSNTLEVGDHTVVLGAVAGLSRTSGDPLVYGRRHYGRALLREPGALAGTGALLSGDRVS